jgi:hypothetical protein
LRVQHLSLVGGKQRREGPVEAIDTVDKIEEKEQAWNRLNVHETQQQRKSLPILSVLKALHPFAGMEKLAKERRKP